MYDKLSIKLNSKEILQPKKGCLWICNLEHGERKIGSLYLSDDNMKLRGIRPRFANIFKIGEGLETELNEGDWCQFAHGEWTTRIKFETPELGSFYLWLVPAHAVERGLLAKYKEKPIDIKEEIHYNKELNKWIKVDNEK